MLGMTVADDLTYFRGKLKTAQLQLAQAATNCLWTDEATADLGTAALPAACPASHGACQWLAGRREFRAEHVAIGRANNKPKTTR